MRLAEYFIGAAAKYLTSVEADPQASNQHELNGIGSLKHILGTQKSRFESVFLYLSDQDPVVHSAGVTTWYDAREHKAARSPEYRLYIPRSPVSNSFRVDDLLVVLRRPGDLLLVIATPKQSTFASQLLWLFGLVDPGGKAVVKDAKDIDRDIDYVARLILDTIGVDVDLGEIDLDLLIERFGLQLPATKDFSKFARDQVVGCDPVEDADHALLSWLDMEERCFRAFEHLLVESRLREGFVDESDQVDVDGFVSYSLSVQNRRKSRAGHSLENHLEEMFLANKLAFERGKTTEGRSKPDFLFPGQKEYLDPAYPEDRLTVLGAKASCKDRWRQVTAEAQRVRTKHLVTLEPSISANQTSEMKSKRVQLILPRELHATYGKAQRTWIWSLDDLVKRLRDRQL